MIKKLMDLTVDTLCLQILLFVQDDRTKGLLDSLFQYLR